MDKCKPFRVPTNSPDDVPPTFISTGTAEIFRDENIEYAQRLIQHGISVELHAYPGAFHGWEMFAPRAAISRQAREDRIAALIKGFAASA